MTRSVIVLIKAQGSVKDVTAATQSYSIIHNNQKDTLCSLAFDARNETQIPEKGDLGTATNLS